FREEVASGKADVPLIELPQAISVVSTEQLQQRGVTRIADALFTVAGASRSSTYGFYDAYTLRGFDAAYGSLYLDGLINEAGGGGSNNELFGLESVEVVKGPASALFGGGSLGGLINLVSKRPVLDSAFATVSASTGSYDLVEGAADANLPLNADRTLAARVTALYRDSGAFVRFAGFNRIYVQPSLTWQVAPSTRITVLATLKRDDDNPWGPLPAYGTVFPLADGTYLPRDFAVSNGGDYKPVQRENRKTIGYFLDHDFTDSLHFSQNTRYMHRTTFWDRWMFADGFIDDEVDEDGNFIPGTGRTIGRYYYGPYNETFKSFLADNRLTWKIATGPLRHNLLGGVDYRETKQHYTGDGDYDPFNFPLDIHEPDYFAPLNPVSSPYSGSDKGSQLGFYIQDHIEIGEALTLTVNGRWDRAKFNGEPQNAFSPRVGATWKVTPGVSLYGTWSKSFTPQFGSQVVKEVDEDGNPSVIGQAPPERGRNIEGGAKFDLASANLSGMVSLYELTRTNVLTGDPQFPMFSRVGGKQRSLGAEVEVHWRPGQGFSLDFAYAYIKAKYLEDTDYPAGTPLPNIPKHNVAVFGSYVVPEGVLAGLGANLGVSYTSTRYTYDAFPYPGQDPMMVLGEYWLVNGGLSYAFGTWEARVNVNNIFNERYIPDACCLSRVTPGEPRNWRLTVRKSF
ncbi:MAG TPA: TonB-dependent siderophore receptor, partial [Novosphingobium sp.]|nr:TonB-dependent siderophore receptor [Novosphingobium sp.]